MDELLKLYLTGKQAEHYARFNTILQALRLPGAFLSLAAAAVAYATSQLLAVAITFAVAGFVFVAAANFMYAFRFRYLNGLVELQYRQNCLDKRGEEGIWLEKWHDAWLVTFGKSGLKRTVIAVIALVYGIVLAVVPICSMFTPVPPAVLIGVLGVGVFDFIVPVFIEMTDDMRKNAEFYKLAGTAVDSLKRSKFGYTEERIAKEAEAAQAGDVTPAPVLLFLKEETERREFSVLNKRSGVVGFLVPFIAALALFLLFTIEERFGYDLGWSLGGVVFFLALGFTAVYLIAVERKKRAIFYRNGMKLGNGEADELRRRLQSAWLRSQYIGNATFLLMAILGVVGGIVLGICQYFFGEEAALFPTLVQCTVCVFLLAAFLSLAVWIVEFAIYRHKVRPTEAELKTILKKEKA